MRKTLLRGIPGTAMLFLIALSFACRLQAVSSEPTPTATPTAAAETPTEPPATQTAVPTFTPPPTATPVILPSPTPTLAPVGEVQPVTGEYAYLGDPNEMALGFNLGAGGSIGSLIWQGIELVDDTDFGRYIQVSPYDGDDVYIGGGPVEYGEFGWNPLQSGGRGGDGNTYPGTVLEFRRSDDGMYVKTLAKEWGAPDDQDSDTVYEVWAFKRDGYFEIFTRATHVGTEYHLTGIVENPAAYFEFALRDSYTYLGDAPFTAAPVEALNHVAGPYDLPGSPACPGIVPTENWAAFARSDQVGLILAVPPQKYLSLDWALCLLYDNPQVGYISPIGFWDFAPGDTRELHYYLVPGDISAGRRIVYDLIPHTTWTFNLDTVEGWTGSSLAAAGGAASVEVSPDAPLVSPPGLQINGRVSPAVVLTARAAGTEVPVCLEYQVFGLPDWHGDPAHCATVQPGDFAPVIFDLHTDPSWDTGQITRLRLTAASPGSLEIDQIEVQTNGQVLDFFSDADAGSLGETNQLDAIRVEDGSLKMESTGDDPYFDLPLQASFQAEAVPRIEIRMKVSAGYGAQLFFRPESGFISEENSLFFEIQADGEFHTYTLELADLPTWAGRIDRVRLDPTDAAAQIEIDYILIP